MPVSTRNLYCIFFCNLLSLTSEIKLQGRAIRAHADDCVYLLHS